MRIQPVPVLKLHERVLGHEERLENNNFVVLVA